MCVEVVSDGLQLILRSFNQLLLVSTADRLYRCSGAENELAHDSIIRSQFHLSYDTAFKSDQFKLHVTAHPNSTAALVLHRVKLEHAASGQFIEIGEKRLVLPLPSSEGEQLMCDAREARLGVGQREVQWMTMEMGTNGDYFEIYKEEPDGSKVSISAQPDSSSQVHAPLPVLIVINFDNVCCFSCCRCVCCCCVCC